MHSSMFGKICSCIYEWVHGLYHYYIYCMAYNLPMNSNSQLPVTLLVKVSVVANLVT